MMHTQNFAHHHQQQWIICLRYQIAIRTAKQESKKAKSRERKKMEEKYENTEPEIFPVELARWQLISCSCFTQCALIFPSLFIISDSERTKKWFGYVRVSRWVFCYHDCQGISCCQYISRGFFDCYLACMMFHSCAHHMFCVCRRHICVGAGARGLCNMHGGLFWFSCTVFRWINTCPQLICDIIYCVRSSFYVIIIQIDVQNTSCINIFPVLPFDFRSFNDAARGIFNDFISCWYVHVL